MKKSFGSVTERSPSNLMVAVESRSSNRYSWSMKIVTSKELESLVRVRIREHRQALGLSQSELAALMGCTKAYISQLEVGERSLGIGQLAHLAECLKTTPNVLVAEPRKLNRARKSEKGLAIA